ncbi:MAG: NAD(P)/FAD-dependent oxidoreductase [Acutalibacter sp.]|jgi:thioredoxin reductase (NADPH)
MWDLLIVGTGPAGVSAALTAKARGLSFLWFGSRRLSEKVEKAEKILNYPGLSQVTGIALRDAFLDQVDQLSIPIREERVAAIYDVGGAYAVCAGEEFYEGLSVILATGVASSKELPGEKELLGKGVSCCATCDGELYRDRPIAVVCDSPALESEVKFLQGLASRVELFPSYEGCTLAGENLRLYQGLPQAIEGDERVSGVRYEGTCIPVEGVFCLRESVAPQALLTGIQMEEGHIQVDRAQRTNLPGCFAAGDCTGRPYQYAKAVGEGNVAVHSVLEYLRGRKREGRS